MSELARTINKYGASVLVRAFSPVIINSRIHSGQISNVCLDLNISGDWYSEIVRCKQQKLFLNSFPVYDSNRPISKQSTPQKKITHFPLFYYNLTRTNFFWILDSFNSFQPPLPMNIKYCNNGCALETFSFISNEFLSGHLLSKLDNKIVKKNK